MNRNKYLTLPALALATALALTACGGGDSDTASSGSSDKSSNEHGGGHSSDSDSDSAEGNDQDVAFAAGMIPHHDEAVTMAEIILAKNPPAEVAAIATQIKDAQIPEIEQLKTILTDMGESSDPAEHSEHVGEHGGMMTDAERSQLENAVRIDAAKLFLQLMIKHHEGAIEASDKQISEGEYEPAIQLAKQIKQAQEAEIVEMEQILAKL